MHATIHVYAHTSCTSPADGALPVVFIIIVVWREQSLASVVGTVYVVIYVLVVNDTQ